MGMSYSVYGEEADSAKLQQEARTAISVLDKLGVEIPDELYCLAEEPYINIKECVDEFSEDGRFGYKVDLNKVPEGVRYVVFEGSY